MRKDDGVGVYILNALQKKYEKDSEGEYTFIQSSGEGSRLMESWQGFEQVIIFDALMKQGEPGRVIQLNAHTQTLPSDFFRYSSHAFSLAEAVEMAKVLDCLPKSLLVYGIEGEDFGFGEGLSAAVEASAQSIIDSVIFSRKEGLVVFSDTH